jgi:signal transduction histidine kinase
MLQATEKANSGEGLPSVDVRFSGRRRRRSERGAVIGPRWKLLAEASVVLDSSLEYQETLANVVRLALPRLADAAGIILLAADGSLMWAYSEHRDPSKAALFDALRTHHIQPREASDPLTVALVSGETQVVKSVDDAFLRLIARDEEHLRTLRQLALTSIIFLPLVARGRVLGTITFATTEPYGRLYTDRDVAIANEVSRRVALACDRALLYREARDAARARDEMVAVVSHDLKNPLATIQLAVGLLLDDAAPNEAAPASLRKPLLTIKRTSERMYRLIHDLLDMAAAQANEFVVTPTVEEVASLVHDALEAARPLAAAKHIALVAELPPESPLVAADRERILQVFSNLLGNAIKFTPAGGRVQVRETFNDEGMIELSVDDTGPGIAPDHLPHIFDRFWQADKKGRSGTGLGLPIAKAIVGAHGGRLRVESEPGQGSRFTFTLRVANAALGAPG